MSDKIIRSAKYMHVLTQISQLQQNLQKMQDDYESLREFEEKNKEVLEHHVNEELK